MVFGVCSVLGITLGCSRTATSDGSDGLAHESETGETGTDETDPPLPINKDIDILFVVDNSGSMGAIQGRLAANVGTLIEVLEADEVDANYRIGITTTDSGNPWCPDDVSTPEYGNLVLSSCLNRQEEFYFVEWGPESDLACADICTLTDAELEILPTTTHLDDTPQPRPWLERIDGQQNIPASTSMADAFRCFGPQGMRGCGFESTLESMNLALERSMMPDQASYGFLRPEAMLAVVILTDEADCSHNDDYAQIFEEAGGKVFWSDPSDEFPTSAVCWNAGVECVGDPSNYEACTAVNKSVDGQLGVDDDEAVLHPMSRYHDLLNELEQDKKQVRADNEIIVILIGGVGQDGVPVYADVGGTDPNHQHNFGIGPGCTAPPRPGSTEPVTAVPPVRMAELVDAFSPGSMFSVCADDYSPAFEAIVAPLRM